MYLLTSSIRDYAWGTTNGVSRLLGTAESGGPEAEMWIGAHPDTPSIASVAGSSAGDSGAGGSGAGESAANAPSSPGASPAESSVPGEPLQQLIARDPNTILSEEVATQFGGKLPFLTKILSAAGALSLQVHPSKARAEAQFAAENAAGIPQDAPERNYRDDNHKPELIFALTDFAALCGFRPLAESAANFRHFAAVADATVANGSVTAVDSASTPAAPAAEATSVAEVCRTVADHLDAGRLEDAFGYLITGGDAISEAAAALPLALAAPTASVAPGVESAVVTLLLLAEQFPNDPGVLISALLNRVDLVAGQALYLPAGNVHAYLFGTGVEVMASSDNVLRGGLSAKHIDVPELLANIDFTPLSVPLIEPVEDEFGRLIVRPPFAEFQVQVVRGVPGDTVSLAQNGPVVFLPIAAHFVLDSPKGDLPVSPGFSAFVAASEAPVNAHVAGPMPLNNDGVAPLAFAVTVNSSR